MPFFKNKLVFFLAAKTPSTPRSYEYKEHQYSWRSPRLGGEIQDYLLEMALNKNLAEIPCLRALRELSG